MAGLKVNFNNVRRTAAEAYNELINVLNTSRREGLIGPCITDDVEEPARDLRCALATLLCLYEEGNPECACVDVDLNVFYSRDEDERDEEYLG